MHISGSVCDPERSMYRSVLNIFNISTTNSPCFCLNNNRNQIIWENKQKSAWLNGLSPVYLPVAAFATCFPALGVAEFDRELIPCETACQDEWQVFVALWDDHVQGKYAKEENLGGGSTIKFMQQSEISTLVNFSRDRRKTQVWNANWIQCTTLQILSKLFNFCFENKCTLSQRWGFKVHPKGQIPGTSEWDASEALQPRFCDQQSSKMFVKSHFMHDTVIRWAMGLSKNNLSRFHLAEGMWNIDCVIYHVNTKLQIKHWSTC